MGKKASDMDAFAEFFDLGNEVVEAALSNLGMHAIVSEAWRFFTGEKLGKSGFGRRPRELGVEDIAVLRDLTEGTEGELEHADPRATQIQMRSAESRLRAVIETVDDGILTIDGHGVVRTFNPAAERIFGYSAAEVIGRNVSMLMPEPRHSAHDGYHQNSDGTGTRDVKDRELIGRRSDGSTFPMDLKVSEITGIVHHPTERRKIERLKNEFVATVSHELRTPLTSIRGALSLLRGKHSAALSAKGHHLLEMASRNCDRLTLLINDLLDLEKIESGSLDFDFRVLDLAALAQQALTANDGFAQQYGVNLRLGPVPQVAAVWGDEHRLLQVFANLLSNAIKYSPKGGKVVVSVAQRDGHYRVSVQDHGRGIPAVFCSRIFQRFAQADSSDSREKGGTGLGLSVTKAIVERHGGVIDFVSEVGVGTVFFVELPAWKGPDLSGGNVRRDRGSNHD
jgi:PAS domain S-box-containing protein